MWINRCSVYSWRRNLLHPSSAAFFGSRRSTEELWRNFFSDPKQWSDHRPQKTNTRYPDFKHKKTEECLWITGRYNPVWVETELRSLAPETVQWSVFSWNRILLRCVKNQQHEKALELFKKMKREGMIPDKHTFIPLLNACASLGTLAEGREFHAQIVDSGYEGDVFINCSLVDMYAKCGSLEDAWRMHRAVPESNLVSWNAIIGGCAKSGHGANALKLFEQMKVEGMVPDAVTFLGVLNACASVEALEEGRRVHDQIIQGDLESDLCISSSLLNMYAKCGSIEEAMTVFNRMPKRDVVSWNSIVAGWVKSGKGEEALKLFQQMQVEQVKPTPVTFVGVLSACASLAALEQGRQVHALIIQSGCSSNIFVGNSLVDMYAKCGSIEESWTVFHKMPTQNAISWNTIIAGCAIHGYAKKAVQLFEHMLLSGVEVDSVTFVALLSACSHSGLVNAGLHHFESMISVYNLVPTVEHYACIVDLLGRAGYLDKAEDVIKSMTCEADATVWRTLLSACKGHCTKELGKRVAKQILELEPGNSSGYVLLSNIYSATEKWGHTGGFQQSLVLTKS